MTEHQTQHTLNAALGTFFLFLGGIFVALIFADRWTELDLHLPRFWYTSRNFHVPLSVACFLTGWWAHRRANAVPATESQQRPVFESCRVFTKPECTLCDRALDVLQIFAQQLPPIELVDISEDAELQEAHGESIPVVEIDGRVRFRGVVSVELLNRLIQAAERKQARDVVRCGDNDTSEDGR